MCYTGILQHNSTGELTVLHVSYQINVESHGVSGHVSWHTWPSNNERDSNVLVVWLTLLSLDRCADDKIAHPRFLLRKWQLPSLPVGWTGPSDSHDRCCRICRCCQGHLLPEKLSPTTFQKRFKEKHKFVWMCVGGRREVWMEYFALLARPWQQP